VKLTTTEIYTHVAITKLKEIHTATHPAARLIKPSLTREASEQAPLEPPPGRDVG
jgi:hypothetical protein